jgi:hypothetical protein
MGRRADCSLKVSSMIFHLQENHDDGEERGESIHRWTQSIKENSKSLISADCADNAD